MYRRFPTVFAPVSRPALAPDGDGGQETAWQLVGAAQQFPGALVVAEGARWQGGAALAANLSGKGDRAGTALWRDFLV